jgi:acyl transferase domain-containing protein
MSDVDLSPKQKVVLAVKEMQSRLRGMEGGVNEAIAVVGIGCRFPGGANSSEAFWSLLRDGVDAVSEVPPERWDVDAFYDPELASPNSMNTRWGGFIRGMDEFDHGFFGISRREAGSIDPQQRHLLETSWEAFEDAGIAPDQLAGTATGVFIGMSSWDYSLLQREAPSRGATGIAMSIAANRLSYFFDLRGPSMVVDSACSSSLTAVDLACQSLRNRVTDVALAGGANALLFPYLTVALAQAGMMAPDGRCKTFDESADGFVRGEGCGVVVLKRLSDALRDRHDIIGLICGSAVNQDGRSNGLTAPNGLAQKSLIRQALKNAGVLPHQIGYLEAHGTGTALGDVVEVEALWAAIGEGRGPEQNCFLGSVKTNIGHMEAAAGVGGLVKVLMCLKHEEIPAHLHLKHINPKLKLDRRLRISTSRCAWRRSDEPRFAGVSSFGFGGTNAHAIVREAPIRAEVHSEVERPFHLLTLSAKSKRALESLIDRYAARLEEGTTASLADICFTANAGRSHFEHRLAVWAGSTEEMRERLQIARQTERQAENVWLRLGVARADRNSKIAFWFPDSEGSCAGSDTVYRTQPTFRKALDECDEFLRTHFHGRLPAQSTRAGAFATQYAAAKMWLSWGIRPASVGGQGVGELVAGCIAGTFEFTDGLRYLAAGGEALDMLPANSPRLPFSVTRPDADTIPTVEIKPVMCGWDGLLSQLASLYVAGAAINWNGFDGDYERRRVSLPTYPFERARCWLDQSELRSMPGPFAGIKEQIS